jgi:hypothetical protein
LIDYLPLVLRKDKVIQGIINSSNKQFDIRNTNIEDVKNQLNIETATWGLEIYEKGLKIQTDLRKSLNERRAVIKSRLRGSGKIGQLQIKLVADSYTNGNVIVSFNGHIVVKFTSVRGIPSNLDDLKVVLEDVRPAHLRIDYEFSYLLIKEINNVLTLNQVEQVTLDNFAGGV